MGAGCQGTEDQKYDSCIDSFDRDMNFGNQAPLGLHKKSMNSLFFKSPVMALHVKQL